MISNSAESGHAPYQNLKIEVKFDKSPKREPVASKQFDRSYEGKVALGAHKRSSYQSKDTYSQPSNNTSVPTHSKDKVIIEANIFFVLMENSGCYVGRDRLKKVSNLILYFTIFQY